MKLDSADWLALSPLIVVAATSLLVMLGIAIRRNHRLAAGLTYAGLLGAFVCSVLAAGRAPHQETPLLIVDRFGLLYSAMILAACFVTALLAHGYLEKQIEQREEFYLLLLLATLGSEVLVLSNHFASFFLGLEILSVSLYALIAYLRTDRRPLEAGIKYFVLAASSAAFLLFGMALLYAESGTLAFSRMASEGVANGEPAEIILAAGLALVITGFGFKLGVVPFHLWTPDVYEGAPAPVTAFVATVSKGSMFALLLRYFHSYQGQEPQGIYLLFSIIAIASMLVGNLLALHQDNVKRILAYSSIAHLGYLLVAFLAGGSMAVEAVSFYLAAYFITTLGAFGVVTVLSNGQREADLLDDYRGLFWRRPWLALVFTAMVLSLAGIPLTAGFLGKFYILTAGVSKQVWALVFVLIVSSVVGLFYYLRIVVALYEQAPQSGLTEEHADVRVPKAAGALLLLLTALLVWLGTYPAGLLEIIRTATARLM